MEPTEKTSSQTPHDGRIAGLDGLRAISILMVLVGHAWATIPNADLDDAGLRMYIGNAPLGVTTFFVISGFLITSLLRTEWEKTGTVRLKAFYARRAFRIFPAFYTYLLAVTLWRALGWIDTTPGDIAAAGTFLANYKHCLAIPTSGGEWFVAHFWTLSLEEQFYLFWPATILAVGLLRASRVAAFIVIAAPVVRVATYFTWPAARGQLGMMLHTGADPIMIGCLAALWQGKPSFERLLDRFSSWWWPLSAAVFLLIATVWLQIRFRGMYSITIGMSLNGIAIAFLLLWVVRHPTGSLCRVLSTPILCRIGVLSYSLYLWQQPFLTSLNTTWSGVFPLNIVACFAAAELSYRLVESPFLRLRSRLRPSPRSPADPKGDAGVVIGEPSVSSRCV